MVTEEEQTVLAHAGSGSVLFHSGLWGAPMGFMWADRDGSPAGRLPQWATDALVLLERRGLVVIRPRSGTRDAVVLLTDAGARARGAVAA